MDYRNGQIYRHSSGMELCLVEDIEGGFWRAAPIHNCPEYTHTDEYVFGERVVALWNCLPVHTDSLEELMCTIAETMVETLEHDDVPNSLIAFRQGLIECSYHVAMETMESHLFY